MMVVVCEECGARFHLDRALLKDSNAARIRCRKCGGLIVVRLPEESPVPTPPVPAAKEVVQEEDSASAPRTRQVDISLPPALETDISAKVRTEPVPPPLEEKVVRRAPFMLKVLVISALWILLLAGGALYFGTTKPGQDMSGKLFTGWGSTRTGSTPERPVYDIRDVKWHVDKNTPGGNLFVIKGSVANVGNVPSAGIRIQATLLGKDNEALAEKAVFAGNPLDEALIRHMDREGIERIMSTPLGEGDVNKEIPPGKALPFMVIFFDPPVEIDAVVVKADDAR